MPPKIYSLSDFGALKQKLERVTEFSNDADRFEKSVNEAESELSKALGAYSMSEVKKVYPEVANQIKSWGANRGFFTIGVFQDASRCFVSLERQMDDVMVWSGWRSEQARLDQQLDGPACLKKMALLARARHQTVGLVFPTQEDKAFMWKAPMVHPLQVLENSYQRIVQKAAQTAEDPLKAQSDTLAEFFIMDSGRPECFRSRPLDQYDGVHQSAVRMNHLIDTFYLFRLLVQYRVESDLEIEESIRVDLSSELTKLLHNGNPDEMGWLSEWLTKKIIELGQKVNALNKTEKKVIFFLKGGRALNYFLGTPEKGENDWDTQVVINPELSAEEWYRCFSEVHDVLLVALKTFKTEFSDLVQQNAPAFSAYLKDKSGPDTAEDEEADENEVSDISSLSGLGEHANCKAELIDIGIPRRDSEAGLEEWTRLSASGSLLGYPGVVYPHREYYLTEYVMMVREAMLEGADVKKAPKRITRLGLILKSDKGRKDWGSSIAALKDTAKAVANLESGRRELFGVMISQFIEAYNLRQDTELAGNIDTDCAAMIANPPTLSAELAAVLLDDAQKTTASDVFTAHKISERMDTHWAKRNDFFEERVGLFDGFLSELWKATYDGLQSRGAQFAIGGSYAARLHARNLRMKPHGLEPIRRVLVKLQCPKSGNPAQVMGAVRDTIKRVAEKEPYKFRVTEAIDGDKQSLLLYWKSTVAIERYTYTPLVMKIRVALQSGEQLPVLASVAGLPVLDLRYLAADYFKKASKVDERGARHVLAGASAAVAEMLSTFQFDSDDAG